MQSFQYYIYYTFKLNNTCSCFYDTMSAEDSCVCGKHLYDTAKVNSALLFRLKGTDVIDFKVKPLSRKAAIN